MQQSPARRKRQAAATELYRAVADLVRVYQFRDRDRICCHDISVTQCYAIEALVDFGPMRLNALADRLFLDKSTTSRVVDALARKGYVQRLADVDDARAVALRVTAAGEKLYRTIHEDLVEQQAGLLADLPEHDRAIAAEVIARLARAAEQRFAGSRSCSTRGHDD